MSTYERAEKRAKEIREQYEMAQSSLVLTDEGYRLRVWTKHGVVHEEIVG